MNEFLLFVCMVLGGLLLELLARRMHYSLTKIHYKEHHFTWGKYLFFFSFPLVSLLILWSRAGWSFLQVFIIFALVGTFLEWIIGFSYYQIVGVRLWSYHKYAITKYTSFLSIPLWGLAGVIFWLLAKALQ